MKYEMVRTLGTWLFGMGITWAMLQGVISFSLCTFLTVITIYKVCLEIRVSRKRLKELEGKK